MNTLDKHQLGKCAFVCLDLLEILKFDFREKTQNIYNSEKI